ncbi:MAG: hypothetical protein ABIY71_02585, partial [Flavobacteriales bacterium]
TIPPSPKRTNVQINGRFHLRDLFLLTGFVMIAVLSIRAPDRHTDLRSDRLHFLNEGEGGLMADRLFTNLPSAPFMQGD